MRLGSPHEHWSMAAGLSTRQRQVLGLLLTGQGEKQVAHRLAISTNTVHVYVKAIYRYYRVCCRAEMMALFIDPCLREVVRGGLPPQPADGVSPVEPTSGGTGIVTPIPECVGHGQ